MAHSRGPRGELPATWGTLWPMQLAVATFNLRNGRAYDGLSSWPFRRRSAADMISLLAVDVIGMQEVFRFQRRYLARQLGADRWYGEGRMGGTSGEQCPIAVMNPNLEVLDHATSWYGDTPDVAGSRLPGASFPRVATIVRCRDAQDGTTVTIANTHLDEHHESNRATSTRQLAGWLDTSTPTIVLGDLNATGDATAVMAPLQQAGLRRVAATGGTAHQFTGSTDGPAIDHIWVSQHWSVVDAEVVTRRSGRRLPSDHWPLRATVALTPA